MNEALQGVLIAQIIFAVLIPVTVFGPIRWGLLAWLIMGNLDATGPGQTSTEVLGWMNAVKAIGVPLWFWWKLRHVRSEFRSSLPGHLLIALIAYVLLASAWSPFPFSAIKFAGNLTGTYLTILVLEKAAKAGLVTRHLYIPLTLISLGLGVVQTYVLSDPTYGFDGSDQPFRLTSFVGAQQYAAYLVTFLTLALWDIQLPPAKKLLLVGAINIALLLNGSRTWVLGAVLVMGIYVFVYMRRFVVWIAFGGATACACLLLITSFLPNATLFDEPSSRLLATGSALISGEDTARNAGLRNFNFRILIYDQILAELRQSSIAALIMGHGTSSGGEIVQRIYPDMYKSETLDPNRMVHNEWLRALYEWGLCGITLLVLIFGSAIAGLTARARIPFLRDRSLAALSFLPAFLIGMSTENVLAGAGSALTMSLGLAIAALWVPPSMEPVRIPMPALQTQR